MPTIERLSTNNYIREQSQNIKQSSGEIDQFQIYSLLTPENQQYLGEFKDHFKQYLVSLGQVWRWQDHIYNEIASLLKENDFHHVLNMLKIASEIKNLKLTSINFSQVELMILSHDGGEIITGDISQHNKKFNPLEIEFIKSIEPRAFSLIVLKNGLNNFPKEKEYIRNIYNRYQNRNNNINDTESHLVKLIDIFDGNTTGLKCIYKKDIMFEKYGNNPPKNPDKVAESTIQKEIDQTKIVLNSIDNTEDKQKLYNYLLKNHLSKYQNPIYGYQEIYKQFEDKIISLNPQLF